MNQFQNYQKYSECQLVATLNASYMLGRPFIDPDSNEYEMLVDLTCARYGSCVCIEKVYEYLSLKYIDVKQELNSITTSVNMNLPISVNVYQYKKLYGLHNVIIVEMKYNAEKENYDLKIPNYRKFTDKNMWINWNDLKKLLCTLDNIGPSYGFFRMFY
jgi:hypothetical protein